MARTESDREDLFEELRTAKQKWQIRISNEDAEIVFGIRGDDRLSIYFGPDPCYHFDCDNRLLRAYSQGALYRTQGATLARLVRERSQQATNLIRHDLSPDELHLFREEMRKRLGKLLAAIESQAVCITRSFPEHADISLLLKRIDIAANEATPLAPAFPTRRQ